MNEYYEDWLRHEKAWYKQPGSSLKSIILWMLLIIVGFGAIGLIAGDGDIAPVIEGLKYVVIVTLAVGLLMALTFKFSRSLYEKRLKSAVTRTITDENKRRKFMKDILSIRENDERKIDFKENKIPAQIICTSDYYYAKRGNIVTLIPLDKIETIDHGELEETVYINKQTICTYYYVIRLYYKGSNKEEGDEELRFIDADVRNYISNLLSIQLNNNNEA